METQTREVRLHGRDSDPISYEVLQPETIEEWEEAVLIDESQETEKSVCSLALQQFIVNQQGAIRRALGDSDPDDPDLAAKVQTEAEAYTYGSRPTAGPSVPESTDKLDDDQAGELATRLRESHPHLFE